MCAMTASASGRGCPRRRLQRQPRPQRCACAILYFILELSACEHRSQELIQTACAFYFSGSYLLGRDEFHVCLCSQALGSFLNLIPRMLRPRLSQAAPKPKKAGGATAVILDEMLATLLIDATEAAPGLGSPGKPRWPTPPGDHMIAAPRSGERGRWGKRARVTGEPGAPIIVVRQSLRSCSNRRLAVEVVLESGFVRTPRHWICIRSRARSSAVCECLMPPPSVT